MESIDANLQYGSEVMDAMNVTGAFNQGSDARFLGRSKRYNPYRTHLLALYWNLGWNHVDKFWAVDVAGCWPFRRLRKVSDVSWRH